VRRRGIGTAGINATGATHAAKTAIIMKAANTNSAACCEKEATYREVANEYERARADRLVGDAERAVTLEDSEPGHSPPMLCESDGPGCIDIEIESAKERTCGPGVLVHAAQKRKCEIPATAARRSRSPIRFWRVVFDVEQRF
jgi:hypothetical protein